jgi:hypothetical protein
MKNQERRSPWLVRCTRWIAVGCAVLAPLACGDDSDPGTTAGSAGTGGTGATGGAGGGGTAGTAGSGGTGGGDTDASGAQCGGIASLQCPEPETSYCDYDDKVTCGMGDITGVCTPRPTNCTADCPGVCGCDGTFYCNACTAHQAGTDDVPSGTCGDAATVTRR